MAKWQLWIKGVYEHELDFAVANEVLLTDLPTAWQTVDETEWVPIGVLGVDENPETVQEALTGFGFSSINVPGAIMTFSIMTEPYLFNVDREQYLTVMKQFTKNYVLLCLDGTYQPSETIYPDRIHSIGSCLVTAYSEKQIIHNYDDGTKDIEFKLRAVLPDYE